MKGKYFVLLYLFIVCIFSCSASNDQNTTDNKQASNLKVGAENLDNYLSLLQNKSVAIVANQTSFVNKTHLVDTLLSLDVNIKLVFAPEHGFRGDVDAGAKVDNTIDGKTGIPIISLYGKNKKPTSEQLRGIECIIFDIQDVGVRFYTYISSLQFVMEAAADHNIQVIVLDRPNPNGFYIDGPVLDTTLRSFVGMNPIPIVHGLTVGEYAKMLVGENWLNTNGRINLTIIPILNYSHQNIYKLPIKPSPNLPNMNSIFLYPSLCLFEGTVVSVGRGTDKPFELIGYPDYYLRSFYFIPRSIKGAAENPKYEGLTCWGVDLSVNLNNEKITNQINLSWLIDFYSTYEDKKSFFNSFFDKLSGTTELRKQIENKVPENTIRDSWKHDLDAYKQIRKKYLIYNDFE